MPGLEPAVADRRVHRQLDLALGDEVARVRLDRLQDAAALVLAGAVPEHHVHPAHLAARLDHLAAEIVQLGGRLRRDRGQQRLLIQEEAHEVVHVAVHELVVRHSRARRVDHAQATAAARLEQQIELGAGEAILVGAVIEHVDRPGAAVEPGHDPAVAGLEVVDPHGRRAQLARQQLVLPPRRRRRALAQQHHLRLVDPRRRGVAEARVPAPRRPATGRPAAAPRAADLAASRGRRPRRRSPTASAPGPRSRGSARRGSAPRRVPRRTPSA